MATSTAHLRAPLAMNGSSRPKPTAPTEDVGDDERSRLEGELAAAKERVAAATRRRAARDLAVKEAMRVELAAFQETIADTERRHQEAVAMIRDAADAEVERILAEARRAAADHTSDGAEGASF